jgi:Zn-dependent peptidase ImmA (M78 family)
LNLDDESRAEPETILAQWGVDIVEQPVDGCPVDAVAAWGADHGPVIILNTAEGSRPAHKHGRRSTLAHEICHLLIDRHGALPFSEVLGGYTPLYLEQRANACAAEFLMPGQSAVNKVRKFSSLIEALEKLSAQYEISLSMVALQIKNSSLFFDLNEEEKGIIHRYMEKKV